MKYQTVQKIRLVLTIEADSVEQAEQRAQRFLETTIVETKNTFQCVDSYDNVFGRIEWDTHSEPTHVG